MRKSLTMFALVVSVGSPGCGGGSGSATCEAFSACGGSVVGTWNFVKMCMSMADAGVTKDAAIASSCSMTTNESTMSYSGTLTFGADGSYTTDIRMTGSTEFTYSAGCLTGSVSCARLGSYMDPDAGISVSCSEGSGGSCTCKESFSGLKASGSPETYTASGNTLTLSSSSGDEVAEYCVRGNTLMLHSLSSTGVSATMIATR